MTTRRHFLLSSSAAALTTAARAQSPSPNSRLRVAVMGLGRGMDHIKGWMAVPNVEIAGLCDVDRRRVESGGAAVTRAGQSSPPRLETDVRRLLEDPSIDVLSIAAPNFWHTPATILACAAGKHVYVEKPGSHTGQESEWIGAAAAAHRRLVQQGTQRRSLPAMREAIQRLKEGAIGTVRSARCWYTANRGAISLKPGAPLPDWLDWTLWQGPCPDQPYLDGLVHYNWHWRWHYGGGELANNGVHALDLALWGLDACWADKNGGPLNPLVASCTGGRYHFKNDQQTPDTFTAAFDFGHCGAFLDNSSCSQRKGADQNAFVTFYGDSGSLALSSSGYKIFDPMGAKTAENEPPFDDRPHFLNLANAIREGTPLHCDITTGQRSARLCHLGNIAHRLQTTLVCDPSTGTPKNNPAAQALWSKPYRPGWEPKI